MLMKIPSFMTFVAAFFIIFHQDASTYYSTTLDEEFGHYMRTGRLSPQFHENVIAGLGADDTKNIPSLDEESSWYDYKTKNNFWLKWQNLAVQDGLELKRSILYLKKTLDVEWDGETALLLADRSIAFADSGIYSDEEVIPVLHYAFVGLHVQLKESVSDLIKKTRALPSMLELLERLGTLTEGYSHIDKFGFSVWTIPNVFDQECIPQAQICELLVVAHGARFLNHWNGDEGEKELIEDYIYIYANFAMDLYLQGLDGPTTPERRQYFLEHIVGNILNLVRRVPGSILQEEDRYKKILRKNARDLARIYKDKAEEAMEEHKEGNLWPLSAYWRLKAARAYFYAGKGNKALSYVNEMLTQLEEMDWFEGIKGYRAEAGHLKQEIENPEGLLGYECKHFDYYWGR